MAALVSIKIILKYVDVTQVNIVHQIDNKAVVGAISKCFSSTLYINKLAILYNRYGRSTGTGVFPCWIASRKNTSDFLTRKRFTETPMRFLPRKFIDTDNITQQIKLDLKSISDVAVM